MADRPVDTTNSPFISVLCADCGTHVVAVPDSTVEPLCIQCRRGRCNIDWPWFEAIGSWHPTVGYCSPGQAWVREVGNG
jgi:hypothetical protein